MLYKFTLPKFKDVSDSAKLLYGLMIDCMGLSLRSGWVDEYNRAFIYFTVKDVTEQMCCSVGKAVKLMAELDSVKGIGLVAFFVVIKRSTENMCNKVYAHL